MLGLVLTNVPDLCDVHVHGNVGRSDHSSLGVALNLSLPVPLKSRVIIGMPFVRLCLDLTGEVFSGVRPWFRILIGRSVEYYYGVIRSNSYCKEKVRGCGLV